MLSVKIVSAGRGLIPSMLEAALTERMFGINSADSALTYSVAE